MVLRGQDETRSPQAKTHNYLLVQAVIRDIIGPLNIPGMPAVFQRYFIAFIKASSRYTYVKLLTVRSETPNVIQMFLDEMQETYGQPPYWLISHNTVEYMSKVVEQILGDMDVHHVPIVPNNSEENVLAESFNGTIMNAVRAVLSTANIPWEYCTWSLAYVTDKYKQLRHKGNMSKPASKMAWRTKPNLEQPVHILPV